MESGVQIERNRKMLVKQPPSRVPDSYDESCEFSPSLENLETSDQTNSQALQLGSRGRQVLCDCSGVGSRRRTVKSCRLVADDFSESLRLFTTQPRRVGIADDVPQHSGARNNIRVHATISERLCDDVRIRE
ncbi:hypothetical protein MTO96_032296 [Rhipicephalus appendiculatus]